MKVVLVYLIKGEAQKYQKRLIKQVADISGERYVAYDNPIAQHITLNSPFRVRSTRKLESLLEKFAAEKDSIPMRISGFGNFKRFVAFLKLDIPRGVRNIQKELIEMTRDELNVKPNAYDLKWHPHATVAYGNTKASFNKIWHYLKEQNKPEFDVEFDNITILRKPKKLWEVHKIYGLGGRNYSK